MTIEDFEKPPKTSENTTKVYKEETITRSKPKSSEEGSYTVTVPLLSGCITEGDTREEAIANAKEAIAGYIGALKDLGKPIPLEIPVEVNAESIL